MRKERKGKGKAKERKGKGKGKAKERERKEQGKKSNAKLTVIIKPQLNNQKLTTRLLIEVELLECLESR